MDIRKKGAIFLFLYNAIGTLIICSSYPGDPLYSNGLSFIAGLTFPITIISFAYRYGASEPLYPVFIIQFIVFIITTFILDLILRNYSPAYIEKKRAKFLAEEEHKFDDLLTSEQITIYLHYPKDINCFIAGANPEEKAVLSVEQWYTIDNMANDILLIKKGEVSASTKGSIERRIKDKFKDQESFNLLYSIEQSPPLLIAFSNHLPPKSH